MANQVLRVDGYAGSARIYKSFAAVDEVFLTLRLLILSADLAMGFTGDIAGIGWGTYDGTGHLGGSGLISIYETVNTPPYTAPSDTWVYDYTAAGDTSPEIDDTPPPLADTWQTLELHYSKGALIEFKVDGVTVTGMSGSITDTHQAEVVAVGESFGGVLVYIDDVKVGTTEGGSEIFADDFEGGDLSTWTGVILPDAISIVDDPLGPVTPTPSAPPPSLEWRFAVTKLNLRVLTFFDRLARDRKVIYTLNKAAVATGVVPSDDPEVYLVQNDGFPLLDEGVRCLLGFRREGGSPPWVCRFAGIIMQVEDNVDENGGVAPYSTFTAYDPRQLLYSRPVRKADGNFPGADGISFDATPGNEIALALLERTFVADGEHFIDVDSGSIETTDAMDIQFQQGTSVGEALDQLADSGNLDVILSALYDPIVTPNKLAVFNCYALAGTVKHKAAMAWDKPPRSLVGVNRLKDGTQRANRLRYTGDGGIVAGTESDFAAAVQYGDYWAQQSFPGSNVEAVELLAAEQLLVRAKGIKTYKLNPVPGSLGQIDSPLLFLDYNLGDTLPIYASSRLRHEIAIGKRVISIPVNIADDGHERIEELELGEGESEVS